MGSLLMTRNLVKLSQSNLPQNILKLTSLGGASARPSYLLTQFTSFSLAGSKAASLPKNTSLFARNALVPQKRLMSADHSKLWPLEKALAVVLIGLVPATFAVPNPVCDNLFAVLSVIHLHWGLEACVVDYVRPIIFGPAIPKLTLGLLYLISAATLGGLIYFNTHDIGVGQAFRKFWAIKE